MRRTTKLAAAVLVATCVMAVGRSADASLWGALITLMEAPARPAEFQVRNNAGRKIEVKIDEWDDLASAWYSCGGGTVKHNEWVGFTDAPAFTYRVRLRVWNSTQNRWVLKDRLYVFAPAPFFIEAYKAGRGDFRLRRW